MEQCDDKALGCQNLRNHLVQIALLIDILISLLDVILAAIGTFILFLGHGRLWLICAIAAGFLVLQIFLIILYRAAPGLQQHPYDWVYLIVRRIVRAVIFFLLALVLPVWFVVGLTLAQHGYMLSVIVFACCLDVQGIWIHLISGFIVVVAFTVGYVFLHVLGYFAVMYALFVIFFSLFESTTIGLNIFWTLVWWEKLGLHENEYCQETIYIMNGYTPLCCEACRCCDCCEPEY